MDRDGAAGMRSGGDRPGRGVAITIKEHGKEHGSG